MSGSRAGSAGTGAAISCSKMNWWFCRVIEAETMSSQAGTLAADPGPVLPCQAASPTASLTTLVSAAASNATRGWLSDAVGAFRSVQPAIKALPSNRLPAMRMGFMVFVHDETALAVHGQRAVDLS